MSLLLGIAVAASFANSAFAADAAVVAAEAEVAVEAPAPVATEAIGAPPAASAVDTPAPTTGSGSPAVDDPSAPPPPSAAPATDSPAPAAEVPSAPVAAAAPASVVEEPPANPDPAPATPARGTTDSAPPATTLPRQTTEAIPGHSAAPTNAPPVATTGSQLTPPAKVKNEVTATPVDGPDAPVAPVKSAPALVSFESAQIASSEPGNTRSASSFSDARADAASAPPVRKGPSASLVKEPLPSAQIYQLTQPGFSSGSGSNHSLLQTLAGRLVPGALNNSGNSLLLLFPIALLLAAWAPPRTRILLSALRLAPGGGHVGYASVALRPG